jgi:predicted thioesterase
VFPPVFATARMIALMELAAARCLLPRLRDVGERSVGVGIEATHTAPTPVDTRVTARATWLGQEGKVHRFSVVVEDEAGEVGRGTHTRVTVQTGRLLAGAAKRARAH